MPSLERHIEVEDLVVRYGDVVAVDRISFEVRRGEHMTLLGPSGCGKTTTLRALARSLARSRAILLLDAPLSNRDARLRAGMRLEIQALQRQIGLTSVYVTHDQEEALVISDRIIVMNAGRIEQIGSAADIYDTPRNAFVADFVGAANLISGTVRPEPGRDGLVGIE